MTVDLTDRERRITELGYMPTAAIIGPGEILELAGVGWRTLGNWRSGKNLAGAGPFPEPIRCLKSGDLFDRRAVSEWLREHRARH